MLTAASVLAAGVSAPGAVAAVSPVIADCNSSGHLTRHYTVVQLRTALNTMPADVKEYTDCYDVIQQQLLTQLSGGRAASAPAPSSGGGGSFLPTPLLVVLVVLVIGAAGFGIVAVRRRR